MHEIIDSFGEYWRSLRAGRDIPRFLDFDINQAPSTALPYMSLVQVHERPRRFQYRLAGTSIAAAYREDISGKFLDELDMGGKDETLLGDFHHVVDRRETHSRKDSYELANGTLYQFQGTLFPFEGVSGRVSRIIIVAVDDYQRPGSPGHPALNFDPLQ